MYRVHQMVKLLTQVRSHVFRAFVQFNNSKTKKYFKNIHIFTCYMQTLDETLSKRRISSQGATQMLAPAGLQLLASEYLTSVLVVK